MSIVCSKEAASPLRKEDGAKTLYLHIGMGRCGSSALQAFADENRAKLLKAGIDYPLPKDIGLSKTSKANALELSLNDSRRARGFEKVADYVRRCKGPTFLLSSEFFWPNPPAYFASAAERLRKHGIKLKILVYIREQREWMISRYAQAVKSRRWTISLEEYLRDRYASSLLDYSRRFPPFLSFLDPEDLIIRIYERDKLAGGDVCRDALTVMNVDLKGFEFPPAAINASASIIEVELMREVNKSINEGFNHRLLLRINQDLASTNGWTLNRDLYRLAPPALLQEIGAFYTGKNEEFKKTFLPDIKGPMFKTRIPQEYEPLTPQERINEQSIAMLSEYFARLKKSFRRDSPDIANQRPLQTVPKAADLNRQPDWIDWVHAAKP